MTPEMILDIKMQDNDAGAATIRGYLVKLLQTLWCEGEGFSGKRPFGNSGWDYELYTALVKAGAVQGVIDDGELTSFDEGQANATISIAINELGK